MSAGYKLEVKFYKSTPWVDLGTYSTHELATDALNIRKAAEKLDPELPTIILSRILPKSRML